MRVMQRDPATPFPLGSATDLPPRPGLVGLPVAGGAGRAVGEAVGGRLAGAVRVAQGPLRPVVADRPGHPAEAPRRPGPRPGAARDGRPDGDDEARLPGPRGGGRRGVRTVEWSR